MALFVAAVNADPAASEMDRALAAFGERRFVAAAENAGLAAMRAGVRREAAEQLAERATREADAARDQERAARTLEGHSLEAAGKHSSARVAFQEALELTPRAAHPTAWAALHHSLGVSASCRFVAATTLANARGSITMNRPGAGNLVLDRDAQPVARLLGGLGRKDAGTLG